MRRWPFPRHRPEEKPRGLDPRWLREARVQLPVQQEEGPPEEQPPEEPRESTAPEPRRTGRRLLAAVLAVLQVVALIVLVLSPTFRVREIDVLGVHRMSPAEVVAAAGLSRPGSIFLVDGAAVRRRLQSDVRVRASAVSVELPNRVVITVAEWDPVAAYHVLGGGVLLLNDRGQVLGPAAADAASLPQIQGPAASAAEGATVLDPRLLTALVNMQRGLPGLIGQQVTTFQLDRCWNLTMIAGPGWRTLFGHMLTAADYDSLPAKLAALQAVAPYADFNNPATYVNVMNPDKPAVGKGRDQPPPPPTPIPTPRGTPATGPRTATPVPTPTPTPVPNPCA